MAATNSLQSVVWATTYQPLGKTQTVVGSITQNLRLPGQYFDGETGLNHNGFRDYMPQLGLYTESDPIGIAGGYATFVFANTNPLTFTDPFGLSAGSPNPSQTKNTSGSGVNPNAGLRYECWIASKAPYGGHLVGAWLTLDGWSALTDYGPWKGQKPAACEGQTQQPPTVTYVASYEETGYTTVSDASRDACNTPALPELPDDSSGVCQEGQELASNSGPLITAAVRSTRCRCTNCGATTGSTYYPYCPDCFGKSQDPKGGVPPIDPIDQLPGMKCPKPQE
jgi:RHS repeat-associated protein